jgi:nitrosocyanin
MRSLGVLMGLVLGLLAAVSEAKTNRPAAPPTASFTLVNLEYEGTKIWLPGEITVKKGTKVTLKLINNAPSGEHGFSIPAFHVAEVVQKGEPKTVEFTADKVGIFPFLCQLHPAHVGGQIVVIP